MSISRHIGGVVTVLAACSLAGCEATDKMLGTAERTLGSKTGHTVVDIIGGKDPAQIAKQRMDEYARNPEQFIRDLRSAQREFQSLMDALSGKAEEKWGKKEVKLPEQKKYVKYTQNYRSRAVVDFDTGTILVETVDDKDPQAALRQAIVTTLLTPQDPRAVDLFSDKEITLTGDKEPYLLGLVVDQQNKPIRTPESAESHAAYLLTSKSATRVVEQEGGTKQATYVTMKMVANLSQKQAEKYRPIVQRFAEQYKISPSLVFAVIRTESNFNPYAVSSAPAFGLMQLVPTSGGREAYRKAKGQDVAPSREYLFDPENNVELGTAYLNVLTFNQLEGVANQVSREYCVISAYNTGPSNVFKTFAKSPNAALEQINSMQPAAVYDKLRASLPYQETRQYLEKVTTFRRGFVSAAAPSN